MGEWFYWERVADLSEEKEDLFKFENDESWIMRYERELVYFILCELNFELVLRFLYTVYFHFMKLHLRAKYCTFYCTTLTWQLLVTLSL